MATNVTLEPEKTYKTIGTLMRAVDKLSLPDKVKFIVCRTEDDRFYPVFIGEEAILAGVHFHFCVIG